MRLPTTPNRAKRWLAIAATLFLLYWLPLIDFAWVVGRSVYQHGVSRQSWEKIGWHADWFRRFFTGPPSDAEMIAFWHRHRADFDRMAELYVTGRCQFGYTPMDNAPCAPLEDRLGVDISPVFTVTNSAYARRALKVCGAPCQAQAYRLRQRPQDWWRSTNLNIKAWVKSWLWVPPLLPGPELGLSADEPTERDEAIRRYCGYRKTSLDRPIPELLAEEFQTDECGYRPLGNGWYLELSAYFKQM